MSTTSERVVAFDVLRGLALALMLLVNNPGSWSHVFAPLKHAAWHGATLTDLVFPFFLFVVGASMACSLRHKCLAGDIPWPSVIRRSLMLIGIGILLQALPFHQDIEQWRIPGVLQRIGLCFLLMVIIIRWVKEQHLWWVGSAILLVYWLALELGGAPAYALETNLVRHLDLAVFGEGHMWKMEQVAFDPEGLLSTLPAVVTVLSGYLLSIWLQANAEPGKQVKGMLPIGLALMLAALLWSFMHPINKNLWTGSFVLFTGAWAVWALALIIALWHLANVRIGLEALRIYGSNPIFIYVLSWLVAVALDWINIGSGEGAQSLKAGMFAALSQWMPPIWASLVYALGFVLVFYLVSWYLYKKRIFIKL